MKEKQSLNGHKIWKTIWPALAAGTVTVLIFFLLQGIPVARTLYRRTDIKSASVVYEGAKKELTEEEGIVRAAEVCGMLSRRFPAKASGGPDTYYEFTFADGDTLTIGVTGDRIFYKGKWYAGAAGTPELFLSLTESRFFAEPASAETEAVTARDEMREDTEAFHQKASERQEEPEGMVAPGRKEKAGNAETKASAPAEETKAP